MTVFDVLPLNTESPLYCAVMLCVASVKSLVSQVARVPLNGVPASQVIGVAPSKKVTVPVGVPEAELTVAVNVTVTPGADGFCDEPSTVVVAVWPTAWETAEEVLVLNVVSPLYVAVTLCGEPVVLG